MVIWIKFGFRRSGQELVLSGLTADEDRIGKLLCSSDRFNLLSLSVSINLFPTTPLTMRKVIISLFSLAYNTVTRGGS